MRSPKRKAANFEAWPLNIEAISDPALRQDLAELRLHPTEVTAEMVLPFLPEGHRIDQETDERLALVVATLARTASIHGAATWIAEHRAWNLLAVHFDLVERLSSAFLQYRAPRMAHVTETDHGIYRDVVDGAYQFLDMLLGRYLELIDSDCHIIVASDHGYLIDDLRPDPLVAAKADYAVSQSYRELGVLAIAGPGIKKDELVFGASIHDVAPTILSALGLPVGRDLAGRVLTEVFETPIAHGEVERCSSPDFGARCSQDMDSALARSRIVEYSTLGYHRMPPPDAELASELAEIKWLGNLAGVLIAKREHTAALHVLQQLLELDPDHHDGLYRTAQCQLALGDIRSCRETLNELTAAGHDGPLIQYLLGKVALADGDTEAAQSYLDNAESSSAGGVGGQRLLEYIGCAAGVRPRACEGRAGLSQSVRDRSDLDAWPVTGSVRRS